MSIVAVNLVGQGWDDSKDGARSYRREYLIHSDNPDETMLAVRAALPLAWESDPIDAAAVVVTRSAEQDPKARKLWRGEVIWEWAPTDPEDEDPLDRQPKIRWTSQTLMVPIIKDRNGDAVVNAAGDYFDPPPEVPRTRWVANIQFNATAIPTNIRSYANAVNNSAIVVDGEPVASERAMVMALDISDVQYWGEAQTAYRSITLALEVRDDDDESFDVEVLNQGYRELNDNDEPVDIYLPLSDDAPAGAQRERVSAPVMLDIDGKRIAQPDPTNVVFLTFQNPYTRLKDLTIFPGITS